MKRMFNLMGVFLVDRLRLDQSGKGKTELHGELIALSRGKKAVVREYYIRKTAIFLAILLAGIVISVIGLLMHLSGRQDTVMKVLGRPGYGENDRKEALSVYVSGEETAREMEITVQSRKYTEQEKKALLDHALEEIERLLPGDNSSLDEVRSDLYFPETMENGAVNVEWATIPYGVIGEDGSLKNPGEETGTLVEIQSTLSCDGRKAVYTAYANIFPPDLSEEEELQKSIQQKVRDADDRDKASEALVLPEEAMGRTLTWSKPEENPFPALMILTVVLAAGVYVEMDGKVHQRAEDRKNQLMLDYPDLMWKMTMLLGAGLSIKGTFTRISGEYLRERKERNYPVRYVYEEVSYACYEMESGVPEAEAYERFGRRCQLPEYIRLGSVLSQNLKKGAKGLTGLLETEAESSLNDRKNHARKIGEKAGTKLLLPMALMLGIVLVILMVPAFLSF